MSCKYHQGREATEKNGPRTVPVRSGYEGVGFAIPITPRTRSLIESLKAGKKAYPKVGKWVPYCEGDIEEPTFIDEANLEE